jgi:hypothetical protein
MMDDKDVYKMAKWLAQCTMADGHANLSTVVIKHLQIIIKFTIKALIYIFLKSVRVFACSGDDINK